MRRTGPTGLNQPFQLSLAAAVSNRYLVPEGTPGIPLATTRHEPYSLRQILITENLWQPRNTYESPNNESFQDLHAGTPWKYAIFLAKSL